jgi:hypothetical protein
MGAVTRNLYIKITPRTMVLSKTGRPTPDAFFTHRGASNSWALPEILPHE